MPRHLHTTASAPPAHARALTSQPLQQGNEAALKDQVRQQFKMNMHETDDAKILQQKEA